MIQVLVLHTPTRRSHWQVLMLLVLLVSRQLMMMAADLQPSVAAAAAESPSKPAHAPIAGKGGTKQQ